MIQITVEYSGLLLHTKDGIEELSPGKALELIHQLQDALFTWHEKTKKNIDEPICY